MNVWMNGGGHQSCGIAALLAMGELEPPDFAVIADTGYEQSTTWDYLERYVVPSLKAVGVNVHRVYAKDFATVGLYGGRTRDTLLIPAFTNQSGEMGKLSAFCSNEWKVRVIDRWLAKEHGVKRGTKWIGFTVDELKRVQKNDAKWKKRYPLIELRLNRWEAALLVKRMGWPEPPRSSCWMCPNHNQVEWRDIRDNKPDDWSKAVNFDRMIRLKDPHVFLHSDCVPLDQANLDDMNESLFDRCETGACFV